MGYVAKFLAVSESDSIRQMIQSSLEAEGHEARCVPSPKLALEALAAGTIFDFLVLDTGKSKCLEELFSPALLQRVRSESVCILSEVGDTSWKSRADIWNIHNILTKPLLRQDLDKMIAQSASVETASHSLSAVRREDHASFHLEELDNNGFFLAACPAMMQLHRNIKILASVDYPVLILGESGVGKELVARLLHKYHPRAEKPFLNVNTAALPGELLESELFGYEVGAFTGAVKAKPGKFELADKGTLLLDEIGEMSPQMQAKLLHVLQDGTFSRLGARYTTQVDVRILAATNINMEEAIQDKRFREDLYYRLNAFTLRVPPLRERRSEIPLLIEQMMNRGAARAGIEPLVISNRLMEAAQEYHWPGNLRELRNFVTRTFVLQDQDAAYEDLRAKTRAASTQSAAQFSTEEATHLAATGPQGMKRVVKDMKHQTESRMIKEALSAAGWNRRRAATNLNISYRALLYKIQQHGLTA